MPAVALQLFAMPFYGRFIALVSEKVAEQVSSTMGYDSEIGSVPGATQLVKQLRSLFLSNGNLKHKLLSVLRHTEDDEMRSIYEALFDLYSGQHSRFLSHRFSGYIYIGFQDT
jgi:hypothetical protein